MRKLLALCLAVSPLAASCSATSGGGPLPGAQPPASTAQIRTPHDFTAQDLHAGGADFPAIALNLGSQPIGTATTGVGGPNPQAQPGVGSLFSAVNLGGTNTVYYCINSSGTGRKAFEGGTASASAPPTGPCAPLGVPATGFGARVDPLDFVSSTEALSSTEYQTYKTNREPASGQNWGEPFEFPIMGGPIVLAYRPKDFAKAYGYKIRLSTWTLCAIANGTVHDWSDPAITADNRGIPVTNGASEPITFYFREDNSGITYTFTYHLNAACNRSWTAPYNTAPYEGTGHSAAWPYGVNSTWPGPGSASVANPGFVGVTGSPGIIAAVQTTPYGIGYAAGAWAANANPPVAQAQLQGNLIKRGSHYVALYADPTVSTQAEKSLAWLPASDITYGGGSDGQPLATTRPECVLYVDPAKFTNTPAGAYPIIGVDYMLFYGKNNGFHIHEKKLLINFLLSRQAARIIDSLEFTNLSASVKSAVQAAFVGGNGKAPCIQ